MTFRRAQANPSPTAIAIASAYFTAAGRAVSSVTIQDFNEATAWVESRSRAVGEARLQTARHITRAMETVQEPSVGEVDFLTEQALGTAMAGVTPALVGIEYRSPQGHVRWIWTINERAQVLRSFPDEESAREAQVMGQDTVAPAKVATHEPRFFSGLYQSVNRREWKPALRLLVVKAIPKGVKVPKMPKAAKSNPGSGMLPPGFDGFDVFDEAEIAPAAPTPEALTRFMQLRRGDAFVLGGSKAEWVVYQRESDYTCIVRRPAQGLKVRKEFVARVETHDGFVKVYVAHRGDLRPEGESIDAGFVADVRAGAVDWDELEYRASLRQLKKGQ